MKPSAQAAGRKPRPSLAYRPVILPVTLSGDKAARLVAEARRRGVRPVDLTAELIDLIITDDLFKAVLG